MSDKWIDRFGTVTALSIRGTRKGPMATLTLDCTAFTQSVVAYGAEKVDAIKAIGNGGKIWVKGPVEQVTKRNEAGNTYAEDALKVIYLRDSSKPSKKQLAEAAAAEAAGAGEGAADETPAGDVAGEGSVEGSVASQAASDEIPF